MSSLRLLMPGLLALALLALSPRSPTVSAEPSAEDDLVHVTSHVVYDIRPDQGPLRVSWDVTLLDNDPKTKNNAKSAFYDTYSLPVLRGYNRISARSSSGRLLDVTVDEAGRSPVIGATVRLDKPLFYKDTYNFSLQYEIPPTRQPSLLVTPVYVFLPIVASGDEATVDLSAPAEAPWAVSLQPGACTQISSPVGAQATSFTCSGSNSAYLVALAEVSRPDATATITSEVTLKGKPLSVSITYLQGEDDFARHLQELVSAGLPVIEELYGFPYSGPSAINIAERGRQLILGYEGLTTCKADTGCDISVSPIADDHTILHELAHLWSGVFGRRWLSEGFAELIATRAATSLPAGLVQGGTPEREPPSGDLQLQLDDWGDVTSIIGAKEDELAIENAGYYRSPRFLTLLESQLGLQTLQKVNLALTHLATPADSRRYMDVLQEVSGRDTQEIDSLYAQWVFPNSLNPTLKDRRQARDRLAAVAARSEADGLAPDVPNAIRDSIAAWRFADALTALGQAEAGLQTYDELRGAVAHLQQQASVAGLTLPNTIAAAVSKWDFAGARRTVTEAAQTLEAYSAARSKVEAPRDLWERFGLLGSDPEGSLEQAAAAFAGGDFQSAIDHSRDAADAIDDASQTALRRLLIVGGGLAFFALVILGAVWLSHLRQREFA